MKNILHNTNRNDMYRGANNVDDRLVRQLTTDKQTIDKASPVDCSNDRLMVKFGLRPPLIPKKVQKRKKNHLAAS